MSWSCKQREGVKDLGQYVDNDFEEGRNTCKPLRMAQQPRLPGCEEATENITAA